MICQEICCKKELINVDHIRPVKLDVGIGPENQPFDMYDYFSKSLARSFPKKHNINSIINNNNKNKNKNNNNNNSNNRHASANRQQVDIFIFYPQAF